MKDHMYWFVKVHFLKFAELKWVKYFDKTIKMQIEKFFQEQIWESKSLVQLNLSKPENKL